MDCNKCKKSLDKCDCPDIDERMAGLKDNPNFIYKMCAICGKHYQRCKCEEPKWITSHEGVSLEEALGQPTLADRLAPVAERKPLFSQRYQDAPGMGSGDLPPDAPPELKKALEMLESIGINVKIMKIDDPREIAKIMEMERNNGKLKEEANQNDILHMDAYLKDGGKLN